MRYPIAPQALEQESKRRKKTPSSIRRRIYIDYIAKQPTRKGGKNFFSKFPQPTERFPSWFRKRENRRTAADATFGGGSASARNRRRGRSERRVRFFRTKKLRDEKNRQKKTSTTSRRQTSSWAARTAKFCGRRVPTTGRADRLLALKAEETPSTSSRSVVLRARTRPSRSVAVVKVCEPTPGRRRRPSRFGAVVKVCAVVIIANFGFLVRKREKFSLLRRRVAFRRLPKRRFDVKISIGLLASSATFRSAARASGLGRRLERAYF